MRVSSQRAFELAYFIHRDRSVACQLLTDAMDQLETAAQIQDKRVYYRALGRRGRPPRRDKISLQRPQLLQYLIYLESERRELSEESRPGDELSDADRIVRFLVHLVRITLARNSFYASVGIGRLLYRYDTDEIIQLYDVLIQDPDRYRGADAMRACKRKLLSEILKRFGPILRMRRTSRGETVLESRPIHEAPTKLVRDTLEQLTPWGTECSLPADLEPLRDRIASFLFTDSNPDREHEYELRRLHAVLHPACFTQLVAALGFAAPKQRLALPVFFAAPSGEDDDCDPHHRFTVPLSANEQGRIDEELDSRSRRRAPWKPVQLSVYANGVEFLGTIDLTQERRRSFLVPSGLRSLEVWGEDSDGPIRLATYLVIGQENTGEPSAPRVVRLAEGQVISFRLTAAEGESCPPGDELLEIDIQYRETRLLRSWALGLTRFRARIARARRRMSRIGPRRLTVAALLATSIGVVLIHQNSIDPGPGGAPGRTEAPPSSLDLPPRDSTRGTPSSPDAKSSLEQVEAIHIEPWNQSRRLQQVHLRLTERLARGTRFRIVDELRTADAVLTLAQGTSGTDPLNEPETTWVELVNRAGEILWRSDLGPGTADAVAERLAESLETAAAR